METALEEEIRFWCEYISRWKKQNTEAVPVRAIDALELARLRLIAYLQYTEKISNPASNREMH